MQHRKWGLHSSQLWIFRRFNCRGRGGSTEFDSISISFGANNAGDQHNQMDRLQRSAVLRRFRSWRSQLELQELYFGWYHTRVARCTHGGLCRQAFIALWLSYRTFRRYTKCFLEKQTYFLLHVGKMREICDTATAYPWRDANFMLVTHSGIPASVEEDRFNDPQEWANLVAAKVFPFTTKQGKNLLLSQAQLPNSLSHSLLFKGVYQNYLDSSDSEERVRISYGVNWDRLRMMKTRFDPANVFHGNNNIPPLPLAV